MHLAVIGGIFTHEQFCQCHDLGDACLVICTKDRGSIRYDEILTDQIIKEREAVNYSTVLESDGTTLVCGDLHRMGGTLYGI